MSTQQPMMQQPPQDTQVMTPPDMAKAINQAVQALALVQKSLAKAGGPDSPAVNAVNQIIGAIAEVEAYVESQPAGGPPQTDEMGDPADVEASQIGADEMNATAMEGGPPADEEEGPYVPPTSNPFKQAARNTSGMLSAAASRRQAENPEEEGY